MSDPDAEPTSLLSDSLYGLRFIYRHKPLLKFLLVSVFANFFLSIGIVLMPPYGLSFLSEQTYGIANGLFGGGMIVGGVVYALLNKRASHIQLFLSTALIMGALYSTYGFARGVVSLGILNFLLAMLMTIGNTAIITIWQVKVPEEHAGRVLSAMSMVAYSTGPISYLLAGPLTDRFIPYLFTRTGTFGQWAMQTWGSNNTAQMGFLFSAMGLFLFVGFLLAYQIKDVRNVEEHPV